MFQIFFKSIIRQFKAQLMSVQLSFGSSLGMS